MSGGADQRDMEPRLGSALWLLIALALGPLAWGLQLEATYAISSTACYPRDAPWRQSPPPGWGSEFPILLGINLACLALCIAAVAFSIRWLTLNRNGSVGSDVRRGRTRFLAACGAMAGLIFAGAILFNTANIVMVPSCWSIPK
jgi:hypothetical protein